MAKAKSEFKKGDRICWSETPEEVYRVTFVSHKRQEYKAVSETHGVCWIPFKCAARYRAMMDLINRWVRVDEKGFGIEPYFVEDIKDESVYLLYGPQNENGLVFPKDLMNLTLTPTPQSVSKVHKDFEVGDRVSFKGEFWRVLSFGDHHGLPTLSQEENTKYLVPPSELQLITKAENDSPLPNHLNVGDRVFSSHVWGTIDAVREDRYRVEWDNGRESWPIFKAILDFRILTTQERAEKMPFQTGDRVCYTKRSMENGREVQHQELGTIESSVPDELEYHVLWDDGPSYKIRASFLRRVNEDSISTLDHGDRVSALGERGTVTAVTDDSESVGGENSPPTSRLTISFAKTLEQLESKNKTQTRRLWKDSYARDFCSLYRSGGTAIALNKNRRSPESIEIGTVVLTSLPFKQSLKDMTLEDVIAEGFPKMSVDEFVSAFFDGNADQTVWVVSFRFKENSDENYTPNTDKQPVLDLVVKSLGGSIALDPTSNRAKTVPASFHFTKSDDCLSKNWKESVFMNPPYSNPLVFLEKLCQEIDNGRVRKAVVLLKIGAINNKKTGALIEKYASTICHWRSPRIGFVSGITGKQRLNSDFDCCFVYFGSDSDVFCETFEPWGTISKVGGGEISPHKPRQLSFSLDLPRGITLPQANTETVTGNVENVLISSLVMDCRFQPRETTDENTIERYYLVLQSGADLPPVVIYKVDGVNYLGDGWHRRASFERWRRTHIPANVIEGLSYEQAVAHSQLANRSNGKPLNKADIKTAVLRLIDLRSRLTFDEVKAIVIPLGIRTPKGGVYESFSNRAIGAMFGIDHKTVRNYENQHLVETSLNGRLKPGTVVQLSPEAADRQKLDYGCWQTTGVVRRGNGRGIEVDWHSVRVLKEFCQPEELIDLSEEPLEVRNYQNPEIGDRVYAREGGLGVVVAKAIPRFCRKTGSLAVLLDSLVLVSLSSDDVDNEGRSSFLPNDEEIVKVVKDQIVESENDEEHERLLAAIAYFRQPETTEDLSTANHVTPLPESSDLDSSVNVEKKSEENYQPAVKGDYQTVEASAKRLPLDNDVETFLRIFSRKEEILKALDDQTLKDIVKAAKYELTSRHCPKQEGDSIKKN